MAAALPFVALPLISYTLVDRLARSAAAQIASAADDLDELHDRPPPEPLPLLPQAREIAALEDEPADDGDAPPPPDADPQAPPAPPPAHGLMVPRARVEAAARAGHRPGGSGVGATAWRPGGLALHGIGGVGVGLRDGDVVTRVGGTPATSVGAVTSAVRAALKHQQPAITAEVWRGRQRIIVTVELPVDDEAADEEE